MFSMEATGGCVWGVCVCVGGVTAQHYILNVSDAGAAIAWPRGGSFSNSK